MPPLPLHKFSIGGVAFPAEAPEEDAIDNDLVTTIKIVDHLREVKRPVIVRDILEENRVCITYYAYVAQLINNLFHKT
jgi:hypothetical protein